MEPERRIEKELRAYAKKRREDAGAPPELHPATRRLLQDEVARRSPRPGRDNFFLNLIAGLRRGLVFAAGAAAIVLIVAAIFLPSLNAAKYRSKSVLATSNLRQIGQAVQVFSSENNRVPASLDEIKGQLHDEKTLIDPESGQRFVYVGGKKLSDSNPNAVLAYSPVDNKGRLVLFADGHIDRVTSSRFTELSGWGVSEIASSSLLKRDRSTATIASSPPPSVQPTLALNEEKIRNDTITPGTAGEARLQDRRLGPAVAKQNQPPGNAAPGPASETEVAAGDTRKTSTVTTVGGVAAFNDVNREMRPGSVGSPVFSTNTLGLVADSGTAVVKAGKEDRMVAGASKSEGTGAFDMAANAPAPSTANVDELKAGSKMFFKQAAGDANQEASAFVVSQQYVQAVEPANAQLRDKKISSPVLVSFQVQQSDQNIRVVDQDGSVYNGYWRADGAPIQNQKAIPQQVPATPPAASAGQSEGDVRAYKDKQQAVQNYFFVVTGTNQSLKQNIVFNGNFTALTSGVPLVQQNGAFGGGGAGGLQNAKLNQSLQLLLSNGRISGTAIIDNNREIQINALPITAPR